MSVLGLRVGPFEIVGPATVPESGEWFRAERVGITSRQPASVLVKLLPPDADEEGRAHLQREFDNLRAVEDPRVPAAIALYEGIGAMAVDAPDGVTFQDIVDARKAGTVAMTPATLLDLALEVAETLQHTHHRGRHHGHLHAGSVRLSTAGKVTLFGFGPGADTAPPDDWLAPERARSEPSGPASDQWALGSILCALITGHSPWSEGRSAVVGDLETIVVAVEQQWPALARLLRRMTESDPNNRFPSIQPARKDLLALARKAGGASERRELGKQMARRVQRKVAPDLDVPDELLAVPSTDPPLPPEPTVDPLDAPATAITSPGVESPPADDTPGDINPEPADTMPTAGDPPSAPEAPPVAVRAEQVAEQRPAPLADEALDVVAPDLDASMVAPARRDGEDEDISDEPTVQFDPMRARELAAMLEATPAPASPRPTALDMDVDASPEEISYDDEDFEPRTLARALAVAPAEADPFGGMPTAVPLTDIGIDSASGSTPNGSSTPERPQAFKAPIRDDLDDSEIDMPVAARPETRDEPGIDITRFAPVLAGLMALLVIFAVLSTCR